MKFHEITYFVTTFNNKRNWHVRSFSFQLNVRELTQLTPIELSYVAFFIASMSLFTQGQRNCGELDLVSNR